jgi:hypothetical protein
MKIEIFNLCCLTNPFKFIITIHNIYFLLGIKPYLYTQAARPIFSHFYDNYGI